ncbi:glycosyltransferase family 4 protein [Ancylothrix sp. C2]|uniref:MraY family glycosyltransferase n=1 Tax=Ancylothrix sp. D3o TaxID=2953691 RepID=UPI0021BA59AE|nr:glycosyltransferase family 4 protein [Ancylothrix sp. D3o]MCT7950033.1 glycosyltransferase family 4 protein [Ancylothrix sp. D3o]
MALIILSSLSFLVSLATVALIKKRFSQQLLDIPNERSSHTQPTPRGGGLGFIIAFAITSLTVYLLPAYFAQSLNHQPATPNPTFLWLMLTPLTIIGIIDDKQGLPAGLRYVIQLSSAAIAVACFGPFPQPWLAQFGTVGSIAAFTLTVIGMTAMINFYNFMDGLDGIVAGSTAVQLGFLAIYLNQPLLWLLVAALLGFLYWNWSPAKIFMGDAGSTVLGATVACSLLNNHNNTVQAWSALAITLPLLGDAIYTLIRRLMKRENIFKPHRTHLYQRLQQAGWSHAQVASSYITMTLLIAGGLALFDWSAAWIALAAVAGAIIISEIYLKHFHSS